MELELPKILLMERPAANAPTVQLAERFRKIWETLAAHSGEEDKSWQHNRTWQIASCVAETLSLQMAAMKKPGAPVEQSVVDEGTEKMLGNHRPRLMLAGKFNIGRWK